MLLKDGRTALHHAVELGVVNSDLQMARLLLGYGADANVRDEVRFPSINQSINRVHLKISRQNCWISADYNNPFNPFNLN